MIRHAISTGDAPLLPSDFVHLRARGLSASELLRRAHRLRKLPTRLLINDRIDIALAVAADGVHLPSHRIAPQLLRRQFPSLGTIGVSCHSLEEIVRAAGEGADYVFLSPIFSPRSYQSSATPLGLALLARAAELVDIPVIALGGITAENESSCLNAGAAGIAGIEYFFSPA